MSTFKIASAEDMDSMFEDHLQSDKLKNMMDVDEDFDSDEYGQQDDHDYSFEDYDYAAEQEYSKPQQLPLETILEEDSVHKKNTPDQKKPSKKPPKTK